MNNIKKKNTKKIILRVILYTILAIGGVMMVGPFIWMLINSFRTNFNIINMPWVIIDKDFNLENYILLFTHLKLVRAFLNSIAVSTGITVFVIFTSSIVGYIFAKYKFKGKEVIFMYILGSLMAPIYVILIPLYILVDKLNLFDTLFGIMIPFLINGFGIFLMRQFIMGIPDTLIDAARIDGATDFGIYYKIILPLTKPVISILSILIFLWNWDEFIWPLIIAQSDEMKTLPVWLAHFNQAETASQGPSLAGATIVIVPILIVYFFFQKNFVKGLTMTGLKY